MLDLFVLDIPAFDEKSQPGGARKGESARIHVVENDEELTVTSLVDGQFTVGDSGSTTRVDFVAVGKNEK